MTWNKLTIELIRCHVCPCWLRPTYTHGWSVGRQLSKRHPYDDGYYQCIIPMKVSACPSAKSITIMYVVCQSIVPILSITISFLCVHCLSLYHRYCIYCLSMYHSCVHCLSLYHPYCVYCLSLYHSYVYIVYHCIIPIVYIVYQCIIPMCTWSITLRIISIVYIVHQYILPMLIINVSSLSYTFSINVSSLLHTLSTNIFSLCCLSMYYPYHAHQ